MSPRISPCSSPSDKGPPTGRDDLARIVTRASRDINCEFNALWLKGNRRRFVTDALLFVLAIMLLGAVIWLGDAIAGGIESALGEKPLRDRDA